MISLSFNYCGKLHEYLRNTKKQSNRIQTWIDNTINNLSEHSINDSKTYAILNFKLYHQIVLKDIFKTVDVRDFRISVHV